MRGRDYGWVALGGMLGASTRLGLAEALDGPTLALGVFLANLSGTALLAAVSIFSRRLGPGARAFLGTGFCGTLTTVSSLSAEVVGQIAAGAWLAGLGHLGLSLAGALPLAIWLLHWHPPEDGGAT